MKSVENLREQLHEILIQKDGDVKLSEHKDIIDYAKDLGLTDAQLSSELIKADESINWDFEKKKKEESIAREEELKKALELERKKELNAKDTLQFIIEQCSRDKIFDVKEINVFFETSDELKQDEIISAKLLKGYFDKNNYIPQYTPKGASLRLTLQSTDWYKDKLPPPPPLPKEPTSWTKYIVATFLIIITLVVIGYFIWYQPYIKDKNATRMYSYANSLALRSSPVGGANYNAIGNLLYGTEILIYSISGDWAECKANDQKGYVSTQFLLNKKEFQELNGILADADTKEAISTTKCRRALLNYFNTKGIMGKIDEKIQKEIYDTIPQKEIWQVFTKPKNSNPNNVAYPKIVNPNSKFTDFACIIKNLATGKRKFLLFSFSDDEKETLQYEEDAPVEGYIQSVSKYPYRVKYAL